MVDDAKIIEYFINKDRKAIISARANSYNIENTPEYKEYLENRYNDAEYKLNGKLNYCSIIARIYWNIDERPRCKVCGKPLTYKGFKQPYGTWCSSKCQLRDSDFIKWRSNNYTVEQKKAAVQKSKQTRLDRYGNENYNNPEKYKETISKRSEEEKIKISEKRKQTCLQKYGVEYAVLQPKSLEKSKTSAVQKKKHDSFIATMQSRYGGSYTMCSPILIQKVQSTKLQKYGDPNWINRHKAIETLRQKTGYTNPYQIPSVRAKIDYNKINETKRRNKTFNTSSAEVKLTKVLHNIFGVDTIKTQYRDERYKNKDTNRCYICDFYIVPLDLFIEYQGSQYHHGHPYDPTSENDLLEVQRLKDISTMRHANKNIKVCQEDNIIFDWTVRDPKKRNAAKESGIKYLEIWLNLAEITEDNVKKLIEDYA